MYTSFRHYREGFGGTGLQGYVATTYDTLVEVFGEPTLGGSSDGKVSAEWCLKFIDGTVATIYDYKEDMTPKRMYDWHIGGLNKKAVEMVQLAMHQKGHFVAAVPR